VLAHLNEFHDTPAKVLTDGSGPLLATRPRSSTCAAVSTAGTGLRGARAANTPPPRTSVLMLVITAPTQDLADRMAKACNPYFFICR